MESESNTNETVASLFIESANEVDAIFTSFRTLHEIYSASFKNIQQPLAGLPNDYRKRVENAQKAFINATKTVESKQSDISNQLYSQGLVLLMGNAESIIREMFRTLLKLNIRKVNIKRTINLPLDKVLRAATDTELAELILEILESDSNPAEKLNFQNMNQLKSIMQSYLSFELDGTIVSDLHKYWQIRHIIIHNNGTIDKQYARNLKAVGVIIDSEQIGTKICVSKKEYDDCFAKLALLFQSFDECIEKNNYIYRVVS